MASLKSEVIDIIQSILSVVLILSICYCSAPDVIVYMIPLGLVTAIVSGGEIVCAYHRMTLSRSRYAKLRFLIECCIHLIVVVSYVEISRLRFDTLWSIATAYYCFVAVIQVIFALVTPPDQDLRFKVDRSLWLGAAQKDSFTADASEEDYHKDRGDEDWHGL